MMNIKITKGLDLKIGGGATDILPDVVSSETFHILPSDFRWLTPKLLVQPGDSVHIGTPLFADKKNERVVIVSPVDGIVRDIVRGEKRVIEAVVIDRTADAQTTVTVDFPKPTDGQ